MTIKLKKLVAAAGVATLAFAMSANSTFAAADASANVVDDGNATTVSNDDDEFSISNYQHGYLGNFDLGAGNSGGNTQSWGDDENEMSTGNADGWAGSENFLNSTVGSVEADWNTSVASAEVGEDGNATATATDNDEIRVRLKNRGYISNHTIGLANSGFNSQSYNDDGNSMETGDTDAMAAALNEVNSSWINLGGSDQGAVASAEVGDDGNATATAEDNDDLYLSIKNRAGVETLSLALANSGFNSQSGNDDDNVMTTGASEASSHQETFVNSTIINTGDSLGGSAEATAVVGEDGNSTSVANDNDSTTVYVNNNAEVESASVAVGNSGGNTQSDNDDGNSMTTGDASGSTCSTQTVNSFWFGGTPSGSDNGGCY